jgi:integrase
MRIGEALALQIGDVDLQSGIITVRQFKKMPMRLIPTSLSVLDKLAKYAEERNAQHETSAKAAFFVNSKGKAISYASFKGTWNKIVTAAGLVEKKSIPRIHDFRHTFACNHLLRAYKEGRDIDDAIYMLSVYLGHTVIDGTYWYLSATPEILEECIKRTEKKLFNSKRGEQS